MSLLQVSSLGPVPGLADGNDGHKALRNALADALAGTGAETPASILVHGFRYAPGVARADPHRQLFALRPMRPRSRVVSWPRHLGHGHAGVGQRPCIGFGWPARGTLWQAARRARDAGTALARLLDMIAEVSPGRRTDVLCHSLGARVVLGALPGAAAGSVRRIILLAAAEYQSEARAALMSPAGRAAEVFNITSRENDPFDILFETLVPAGNRGDRALGQGLPGHANWLDIQLDDPDALTALARLGHRIAAPNARVCHWSAYLRPGAFAFYRRLLAGRDGLPMPLLRSVLPATPAPRWSRLLPARAVALRARDSRAGSFSAPAVSASAETATSETTGPPLRA